MSAPAPAAVVVVSHMRAGTHLTLDLLRRNAPALAPRYRNLDELVRGHQDHISLAGFRARLAGERGIPVLKSHATPGLEEFAADPEVHAYASDLLARSRIVYVLRDGRDVLVSLYHFTRSFDREARRQSFAEFLRSEDRYFRHCPEMAGLDRVSTWRRHVELWLARPGVCLVSYRELVREPEAALRRLGGQLGLAVAEPFDTVALPRRDLVSRLVRRVLQLADPRHASTAILPGPGRLGDGARWFTAEDEAFFAARAGAFASCDETSDYASLIRPTPTAEDEFAHH
jgi:sulfotransferase family protein